MSSFRRILCPVDLSQNSLAAIELATTIAKEKQSKVVFMYVGPHWMPDEAMVSSEYVRGQAEDDQRAFEALKPCDPSVEFEHILKYGIAGPEIVRESENCDYVVMSTHGRGGLIRLVMGSVAQYTMRNAKCPVILMRLPKLKSTGDHSKQKTAPSVAEVMHQVAPIKETDNIDDVLALLEKANESAAAVVDSDRTVIGVLTKTDIAKYRTLQERFECNDASVIKEMFEFDKYGYVRTENEDFDQVRRHMSSPVVTIAVSETVERANEMFAANQAIHHLVVVDENQRPVGIIEPANCKSSNSDCTLKPRTRKQSQPTQPTKEPI